MRKTPSHTEKKMVYSIRSLKNGTGSVLIGASLVLLAMLHQLSHPTKVHQPLTNPTTEIQPPLPNLLLIQQLALVRTKVIFLHLEMQTLP
ncbi:pullulanase, extracellular [Streptococcus pneumoniae 845]|nr:pullulanase, extracellular [Streptococcus pneumoniae 845]